MVWTGKNPRPVNRDPRSQRVPSPEAQHLKTATPKISPLDIDQKEDIYFPCNFSFNAIVIHQSLTKVTKLRANVFPLAIYITAVFFLV